MGKNSIAAGTPRDCIIISESVSHFLGGYLYVSQKEVGAIVGKDVGEYAEKNYLGSLLYFCLLLYFLKYSLGILKLS